MPPSPVRPVRLRRGHPARGPDLPASRTVRDGWLVLTLTATLVWLLLVMSAEPWTGQPLLAMWMRLCRIPFENARYSGARVSTRSGLWLHVARAIEALKPYLVHRQCPGTSHLPAGPPSYVEPCPWCLGDTTSQPAVRALGAVLGSLADIGFDARWCVLRASDLGAPHRRERVFLTAWPAGRDPAVEDTNEQLGDDRRQPTPDGTQAAWPRTESGGRGGVAAARPEGIRRNEGLVKPAARQWGLDLAVGGSLLASHHTSHPAPHVRRSAARRAVPDRRQGRPPCSGRRAPELGLVRTGHCPLGAHHAAGASPHRHSRSTQPAVRGVDART
ncbi:DNA cytosine methyltransferase [Streptomyces sp. UC4497]